MLLVVLLLLVQSSLATPAGPLPALMAVYCVCVCAVVCGGVELCFVHVWM